MKPKVKRKTNPKYPHKWGYKFIDDLDRITGGKGNEGKRKD